MDKSSTPRRLSLAKETHRALSRDEMVNARGGITTPLLSIIASCTTLCDVSGSNYSCGKIGTCCDEEM